MISRVLLGLVLVTTLGGCGGYVADYVGNRTAIVAPELTRFGLTATQASCVAERMSLTLTPRQLRDYQRTASSISSSYFAPGGPNVRDLLYAAEQYRDRAVLTAASGALPACGVVVPAAPAPEPMAAEAAPVTARPLQPRTWVNLGAAPTGQSIAVEGGSVTSNGDVRVGWFRLSDPGAAPTPIAYNLWIDCRTRSITPLGERRSRADGEDAERRYDPAQHRPLPVEGGTVMEIAFLSLCT